MNCANYSLKALDSRYPEASLITRSQRHVNLAILQKKLKKVCQGNHSRSGEWLWNTPNQDGQQAVCASLDGQNRPRRESPELPAQVPGWRLNFLRYSLGDMPEALRKATQKLLTLW